MTTTLRPRNVKRRVAFRDFKGLNRSLDRTMIQDGQFYILTNLLPLGAGTLWSVPGVRPVDGTASGQVYHLQNVFPLLEISGTAQTLFYGAFCGDAGRTYLLSVDRWLYVETTPRSGDNILNARLVVDKNAGYDVWDASVAFLADPSLGLFYLSPQTTTPPSQVGGAALGPNLFFHSFPSTAFGGASLSTPTRASTLATYAGRLWVASPDSNGQVRTLYFSAPGDWTDYRTSTAGGSVVFTESNLTIGISQMIPANGQLFVVCDSSVWVIFNVSVDSTGLTIFERLNLIPDTGTPYSRGSIFYQNNLLLINQQGVYQIFGGVCRKISYDLDGLWPYIDFTHEPVALVLTVKGVTFPAFQVHLADPVSGIQAHCFLCVLNGNWFILDPGLGDNGVMHSVSYSWQGKRRLLSVFTDPLLNTTTYDMFSSPSADLPAVLASKLMSFQEDSQEKEVTHAGLSVISDGFTFDGVLTTLSDDFSVSTAAVPVSEFTQWVNNVGQPVTWSSPGVVDSANATVWRNDSGVVVNWKNNSGAVVAWSSAIVTWSSGKRYRISANPSVHDEHFGVKLTSASRGYTVTSVFFEVITRSDMEV